MEDLIDYDRLSIIRTFIVMQRVKNCTKTKEVYIKLKLIGSLQHDSNRVVKRALGDHVGMQVTNQNTSDSCSPLDNEQYLRILLG
jgi:hypothetical protein